MRSFVAWAVCILWIAGCATPPTQLGLGTMPAGMRPENVLSQNKVAVAVDVKAPDTMPAIKKDGTTVGFYALSDVARETASATVAANFRPPRPGETPPFRYAVNVLSSKLVVSGSQATYDVKLGVSLQDLYGRSAWRGTHSATATSPYDGTRVPACVWEALLAANRNAMRALSSDSLVMSQLRAPVPGAILVEAPKHSTYECDLRLVDLKGRQILSVSGKAESQTALRTLANELCADLLKKWDPVDLPKVAVLDFKTLGDQEVKVGPAFASFVQDALLKSPAIQLLDRERLALIMQEHNLRASDLVANPGGLGSVDLGIETVDYFLVGQVSVLTVSE